MRTNSFLCTIRARFLLLLSSGLSGMPALAAVPVTQAWAVRIAAPPNMYLQAADIAVAPSGDVYFAGHARAFWFNHDLVVSRHSADGSQAWERRYEPPEGPAGDEEAVGIAIYGTHIYVAGSITSATADSNRDFLILKYRDTGELEWAARWDGPGRSADHIAALSVDGQGNVLVVGHATGTNGIPNIVVLKYGSGGNLLWTYLYDPSVNSYDRAVGIRVDTTGNAHVAVTSTGLNGQASVVAFKLSPNGQELWRARETSGNPYGTTACSLDLDAQGHLVILGAERSYSVLWKYDAAGNRQWGARYRAEESASIYPVDVRFDNSGNIIMAANQYGSGANDSVLIKYAPDGQQLWVARITHPNGSAHSNALGVDEDGNAYLAVSPASDVVTVKVSPAGAQLWAATYDSQASFSDYGEFLDVTSAGDIFMAGRSVHFSESFFSLVKYTQQPVVGMATAVVTPALQIVDPGTNVAFTALTAGPEPIYLQWRLNGRAIADATNTTFEITNVQAVHRGDYSVVVSNVAGATVSPEARLSVRTRPEVTISPTQVLAYLGTDVAFVAHVIGNDFATLQWRHNGTDIPGATNEILRRMPLSETDSGSYDIMVSTLGGSTTSSAAGLKISRVVELVGTTPHRSAMSNWDYAPRLRVLHNGEFLIVSRSNHSQGSSIVLQKHGDDGQLRWTTTFEREPFTNAEPTQVELDGAGNIYVAGLSRQQNLPALWAVLKFTPEGELLWSRLESGTNINGGIHSFAVNAQGRSTIAVLSRGLTLAHYNSAGEVQWFVIDPSPDIGTIAVAVDATGNTYVGTTIDVGGDCEISLRKFDPAGALVWTQRYADGQYNILYALALDRTGHLIVAGTGDLPNVPDSRMFVLKCSSAGQKLWETRTGSDYSELSYIVGMEVGPDDAIIVVTMSDDDYIFGEQASIIRVGADGQLRYRIVEPQIIASRFAPLAVDDYGNAYVTGYYGREGSGADAVTAKYDTAGNRPWLVFYNGPVEDWQLGLAVGVDAAADVRVLALAGSSSIVSAEFHVLHYRQRDPASQFRMQLIPDGAGTFHLGAPTGEPFRVEASPDLRNWTLLSPEETQRLFQPGATSFTSFSNRFFRLVLLD